MASRFQGGKVIEGYRFPLAYEQLSSLASATSLTVPTDTAYIVINVEAQAIRWRDDGVNPTTTVGMLMQPGDWFEYNGTPGTLKFIEVTAGAKINVSYYT